MRDRIKGLAPLVWIVLLALFLSGFQSSNNNYGGPSERFIGGGCSGAAGNTVGPFFVQGVPTQQVIRGLVYIPGYGAPGDTLGLRFNNDSGNNYRYWWLTAAPGGTTFAAGNVAATTDRIKLGAADTQQGRVIEFFVSDRAAKTEKIVSMTDVTGTGAVGTQANIDLGNGAWVSGANVTINQISLVTSNANMAAGTCAYFYAR